MNRMHAFALVTILMCFTAGCSSPPLRSSGWAPLPEEARFSTLEQVLEGAGWARQASRPLDSFGVTASPRYERRGVEIQLLLLDTSQVVWSAEGRDAEEVEGASAAIGEWLGSKPDG